MKALYKGRRARVKVEGMESQWFGVHKGVRQICTLLPCLLMSSSRWQKKRGESASGK